MRSRFDDDDNNEMIGDGGSVRVPLLLTDTVTPRFAFGDHQPGYRTATDERARDAVRDARREMIEAARSAWRMDARRKPPPEPPDDDDDDDDDRLVVDSQDADAHAIPLATACRRRGSRTVNSVKSPTSVFTVMVPPCCSFGPVEIDPYLVPTRKGQFVHYLYECRSRVSEFRFVLPYGHEDADAAHLLTLLRRRHERPRSRCSSTAQ